ncbi:hypothetical protein ACFY96_37895 [Streptomyces massasporeus]
MATVTTTALCLLASAALAGCGAGDADEDRSARSAGDILDEANARMRKLDSVTVDITNRTRSSGTVTSHLVTDLDGRCRSKTTWSKGGTLEQIRLDETDYVRPDRAYLQKWKNKPGVTGEQRLWIKTPVKQAAAGGNGLTSCERPFDSFGTAKKGGSARVGHRGHRTDRHRQGGQGRDVHLLRGPGGRAVSAEDGLQERRTADHDVVQRVRRAAERTGAEAG